MIPRLALVGALIGIVASQLGAQQTQLDLHGNYALGTTSKLHSWGAGVALEETFGSSQSAVKLSLSPGVDLLKQEDGGPTQTTVSVDADIQPGETHLFTPYTGVSAGANWSGGSAKQWDGTRLGLEMLLGVALKLNSAVSLKSEERFGYVKEQEHMLTTRVGILWAL